MAMQAQSSAARAKRAGLTAITHLLQGKEAPSVQTAMDLYHMLGESSTHLRQPVGLETQLLDVEDMDSEVGNSMLQLLQVTLCLPSCTMSLESVWIQSVLKFGTLTCSTLILLPTQQSMLYMAEEDCP